MLLVVWLATLLPCRLPSFPWPPPCFTLLTVRVKVGTGCVGVGRVRVHGSTVCVFSDGLCARGEGRAPLPQAVGHTCRCVVGTPCAP